MDTLWIEIGTGAALGLGLGRSLASFSSRRSAAQPLAIAISDEQEVLSEVLVRPTAYAVVSELSPKCFTGPQFRLIWCKIESICGSALAGDRAETEKDLARVQAKLVLVDFSVLTEPDSVCREAVAELVASARPRPMTTDQLLESGSSVLSAYDDRTTMSGPFQIDDTETRRVLYKPTNRRIWLARVLAAIGLAAAPWLVFGLGDIGAAVSACLIGAVALLALVSVEVALVDYDTLCIDYPVLAIGGGLAWLLVGYADWSGGNTGHLWAGLVAVALVALFELGNIAYKLIRHRNGIGLGDSVLILFTAGIPAAVTGSVLLGWYSVVAAMLLAVLSYAVSSVVRRSRSADVPFAFGPYLVLGWFVAWLIYSFAG